ncbi:centrosomal protein of 152 kDa [Engraulis encrasicolus]|uniref:centrosomal protein of 152 kDa n=1 Tax=Engraulis encrasicolus TaxID=184585 RepID=UPI002FD76531
MSIDFDSNALQTQHEEEELDQEDYAREQELHKLLTDLPDDMLEDSRDCSSPELDDDSPQRNHGNGPQQAWNGKTDWAKPQRPPPLAEEAYEDTYGDEPSYHQDYSYEKGHPPLHQAPQPEYQYEPDGYSYGDGGPEESACTNDLSVEGGYDQEPYSPSRHPGGQHDYNQFRNHFQNVDAGVPADNMEDHYKATYQPRQPPAQMFNQDRHQNGQLQNGHLQNGHLQNGHIPNGHIPHVHIPNGHPQNGHQNGHIDQLQRDFLDSRQSTVEGQQLAQLKVLHQAQARQQSELQQQLEEAKRKIRFLDHQLAIVKDEKEGMAMSLKESSGLLEEAQSREAQLQTSIKTLQQEMHTLTEREQESQKAQRVAEAAVDSLQQQMREVCRSETLTRARQQHERDLHALREQHDARVLALQQLLDTHTQALQEQTEQGVRVREQVRQLERQREQEQVERASIISALTQRLEDSQKQCAKLLHTGSVQEMTQMQIKLQQAQSAKSMGDEMNKALQEELNDLKDQIRLYEAAVKHGVISLDSAGPTAKNGVAPLDSAGDWENHLSDSYTELGIKKVHWKNTLLHSTPLQPEGVEGAKEDVLKELRAELQRCLATLKDKRHRITQLEADLQATRQQLQDDNSSSTSKKESIEQKASEAPAGPVAASSELTSLQEERERLQERVETLEKRNSELRQSEEKVKAANSELCSKMREMIQELDQEKQEAQHRYDRTQQQFRDDVVKRVRAELTQEHEDQLEELRAQHQQETHTLQCKLAELHQEMAVVQECYISICKEKDRLEESLASTAQQEERRPQEVLTLDGGSQTEVSREEPAAAVSQQEAQGETERLLKAAQEERDRLQQETQRLRKAAKEDLERVQREAKEESERVQKEAREERERQQEAWQKERATAVEEAVRHAQQELEQKHLKEVAKHVEGAVARAHARWLEEMQTHPEYKTRLQTQRSQWEQEQEQHTQTQVSAAVKAAKDQWESSAQADRAELERGRETIGQLQEEVRSLSSRLEQQQQQQETLLGAEVAAARTAWSRQQEEETARLQTQHQAQMEQQQERHRQEVERVQEEAAGHRRAELQEALRRQQELRAQGERERAREEARREVKEALQEGLRLLKSTDEEGHAEERGRGGGLRELCREALSRAVALARQHWTKVTAQHQHCLGSEEMLRRVLKETHQQHEKEILQLQDSVERADGVCGSERCREAVCVLKGRVEELQRQVEKACRQLQHTARQHKSALHTIKEEREEALKQERESHANALEEAKRSAQEEGQKKLEAGLEEMKEQYTTALKKIRGEMAAYVQESGARAAALVREQVQREREETTRRMRSYYLTCLQELLSDRTNSTGAEKKIINAASKLAAMAKVLETPVTRRGTPKIQDVSNPMGVPDPTASLPSAMSHASGLPAVLPAGERPKDDQSCLMSALASSTQPHHPPSIKAAAPTSKQALISGGPPTTTNSPQDTHPHPHPLSASNAYKQAADAPSPHQSAGATVPSHRPPLSAPPLSSSSSSAPRGQQPIPSAVEGADVSGGHVTTRCQRRERSKETHKEALQQRQKHPRRSDSDSGKTTKAASTVPHLKTPTSSTLLRQQHASSFPQDDAPLLMAPQTSSEQEAPVRDNGQSDWSISSSGSYLPILTHTHTQSQSQSHTLSSSAGSFLPANTHTLSSNGSYLAAHTNTHTLSSNGSYLRPHSAPSPPVTDLFETLPVLRGEFDMFGSLLGDGDATVYRDLVKAPAYPPEPAGQGAAGGVGGRGRLGPRSLFAELGGARDSGFDSPPSQLRKRPC